MSKALLAEVFYRRDEFARAVLLFLESGREAMAKKLENFQDSVPYQVEGLEQTQLRFVMTDPLPVVQVRVSDSEPVNFFIDTGGAELVIDSQFAKEAGVVEAPSYRRTFFKEAGIQPDESRASEGLTIFGKEREVPFTVDELTLGEAVEHNLDGTANHFQIEHALGFRIGGLISHQFFRRYALTIDFVGMCS